MTALDASIHHNACLDAVSRSIAGCLSRPCRPVGLKSISPPRSSMLTQADTDPRFRMHPISNTAISMGQYVVSPATHPTDCGRFRASFSVQRSQGNGSYCRVFRFDKAFASREAARLFAVTQGWLQTCMRHPPVC